MIPWLANSDSFPALSSALRDPNGLLAAGADLSPQRLIGAYRQGIFPWFNAGEPILWWSPDPRMVMFPSELKISRSLTKTLRNRRFEVRVDTAFCDVMLACSQVSREGQSGTWISKQMIAAYVELHRLGIAHSFETWIAGELAGGLYGVALGRVFYGESMFSKQTDASKIAFVYLVRQLRRWNFGLIDCQMKTGHLASLGAREIPRQEFSALLADLVNYSNPNAARPWELDVDLHE